VLNLPPEGRIRGQQPLDEGVWLSGGSDQTQAARRVLALEEFGSKQRLAKDAEIELAGLGLADDNLAAAQSEWSTRGQPSAGAVDSEYGIYSAGP
jgi:hypothetical protein